MSSFHFYRWNKFNVIHLECTLRTRNSPNFLRRPTPVHKWHDTPCHNVDGLSGRGLITSKYGQNGDKQNGKILNEDMLKRRQTVNGEMMTFHTIQPSSLTMKWQKCCHSANCLHYVEQKKQPKLQSAYNQAPSLHRREAMLNVMSDFFFSWLTIRKLLCYPCSASVHRFDWLHSVTVHFRSRVYTVTD